MKCQRCGKHTIVIYTINEGNVCDECKDEINGVNMTPEEWESLDYFSEFEKWGDPSKMKLSILKPLDDYRAYVRKKVIVHCGYENRNTGYHPMGIAVDEHVEGMHIIDQFIAATRFDAFNGIGVYLWWNNPGLHLDSRGNKLPAEARWGSIKKGQYVPLDKAFFELAIKI